VKVKEFFPEVLVFLFSVAVRVPDLGWDIFNPDSWRWKARSYSFSTALFNLNFAGTAQVPHPGVTLMWISTITLKFYRLYNLIFREGRAPGGRAGVFELHFVQKFVLVLVLALLLSLSFYLLRKLAGSGTAIFALTLLTLEPFFLAHTRAYHLDALLVLLSFVAMLFLLRFSLGGHGRRELLLAGAFSALALLTKSTALFLLPFSALVLLVEVWRGEMSFKSAVGFGAQYILSCVLTFFLLWPAFWVQPLRTLALYFSGITTEGFAGHKQVVFGVQTNNPGFIFYPLSLWLRLSPWLLALALLGVILLVRSLVRREITTPVVVILYEFLFFVSFVLFISIPSKKLERYTLPVYPSLAVMGGFALHFLEEKLRMRISQVKYLFLSVLIVFFWFSVSGIHPDYLAYYNPLAGGLRRGVLTISPFWYFGDRKLGEYFSAKEGNAALNVGVYNFSQLPPFFEGKVSNLGHGVEQYNMNYMVVPIWKRKEEAILRDRHELQLETVLKVGGVPVYKIFKVIRAFK